jgi:hypothetical protein
MQEVFTCLCTGKAVLFPVTNKESALLSGNSPSKKPFYNNEYCLFLQIGSHELIMYCGKLNCMP